MRRLAILSLGAVVALSPVANCGAATAHLEVSVNGHVVSAVTPGTRIGVMVRELPPASHPYCVGLASMRDPYGLPVSLGRVERDFHGVGRATVTVPLRLFPAEPAGPFLLFVGTCTPVAPDRPFVAHTIIRVVRSAP